MLPKNVQISFELFQMLLSYHLLGCTKNEEAIQEALNKKLDSLVMRELYTKYKTEPDEEKREAARQEYLDRRGVPESFRWKPQH